MSKSRDGLLRSIGQQVRTSRAAAELTQDALGKKAGIVGKYVSEIERGTRDIPMSTLQAIVESGLGMRLEIEFRAKNGSRPNIRLPALPPAIEEVARAMAALPADERNRVLAIVRGILGLVS
jgi:transcriptional regulator with XRE-family HTH domain